LPPPSPPPGYAPAGAPVGEVLYGTPLTGILPQIEPVAEQPVSDQQVREGEFHRFQNRHEGQRRGYYPQYPVSHQVDQIFDPPIHPHPYRTERFRSEDSFHPSDKLLQTQSSHTESLSHYSADEQPAQKYPSKHEQKFFP